MIRKHLFLLLILLLNISVKSQENLFEEFDLMPWPKSIEKINQSISIETDFTISLNKKDKRSFKYATNFIRRLANRTGVFIDKGFPLIDNSKSTVLLSYEYVSELNNDTDESYEISFSRNQVFINSKTDIGVIRGLETLLQLVEYNNNKFLIKSANIIDSPRFVWRGLLIDVARHYQPIDVLKRNLDAMASVKLNVFHWHLCDDQGFRVESKTYPKLQELASDGFFYTHNQIREVVEYADNLGIRVVPEFDVPGHASAILTAYPELSSKENYDYKLERFAGIFDPTLNPIKDETYTFLENLFTEIAPVFPDEYFHIGGDENEGKHWDENKEIQEFKKKNDLKDNHELQTYFNIKLEKILNKLGKKLMGWDEILTPSTPKSAVIHSWRGTHEGLKQSTLIEAAQKGYQTVLSNGYYIDRMLSVKHHYLQDPIGDAILSKEERKRILGGEATMWGELVTPTTIDSRIWPRTAAIAERFWSPKNINDVENMEKRLHVINLQLEELGINHIRNTDYILRNIVKGENINALKILSEVCEPLKVYSRNKGGTEYKSFSPFTLFADACVVDAKDAVVFNKKTNIFLKTNEESDLLVIRDYLFEWSKNHKEFLELNPNPIIQSLKPLSKNLSEISELLLKYIDLKELKSEDFQRLIYLKKELEKPYEDVELAVSKSFEKLINYLKKNHSNQRN